MHFKVFGADMRVLGYIALILSWELGKIYVTDLSKVSGYCSLHLEGDCPKLPVLLRAHEDELVTVRAPGVLHVNCLEAEKILTLSLSCPYMGMPCLDN